ncbi:MAG: hypothetical protein IPG96_19865 [Proteobacteria bacterium]|nr:hypothetical protein [Pseudomonadota bacterium]
MSAGILGTTSLERADAALKQLRQLRSELAAALGSDVYDRVPLPSVGATPIFANARELRQDVQQLVQALGLFFGESATRAGSPWSRPFALPVWTALQGLRSHDQTQGSDAASPWVPAVKGSGGTLAQAVLSGRDSQADRESPLATTACVAGMVAELTVAAGLRQAGLRPTVLEPGLKLQCQTPQSAPSRSMGWEALVDLLLAPPLETGHVPVMVEAKMLNRAKFARDPNGTIADAAGQLASTLRRFDRAKNAPRSDDEAAVRARQVLHDYYPGKLPSFEPRRATAPWLVILGLHPGSGLPDFDPYPGVDRRLDGRIKSALAFAVFPESSGAPGQLQLALPGSATRGGERYVALTPAGLDAVLRASPTRGASRASEGPRSPWAGGQRTSERAWTRPTASPH